MERSRPRVLLVDDTPQIRAVFGQYLRDSGMTVTLAEDGLRGLAEARTCLPDAIVCDLEMPNMGGLALCRALREDPATSDVAILVVSGSAALQTREALDAGCDAVLVKPCTGALLVATIERLLANRSRRTGVEPGAGDPQGQ
jgi:CheY-like chemotaxis protein